MPNSTLLFETTEISSTKVPFQELVVVSTGGSVVVRSPAGFFGEDYNTVFPALAPGADRVAWGLSKHDDSPRRRINAVLGVYSLLDKSWKTFGEFCSDGVGSIVFSPDGKRVAFASQSAFSSGNGYCFNNPIVLQILDIATGELTPIPYPGRLSENARLSWSPDGKYLAGEFCCSASSISQIVVIDIASGSGKVLAEGTDPSWSPKGDWIAYVDHVDKKKQKCTLIHPDGTGAKVVQQLIGYWMFLKGAVWSPGGEKLIFNEEEVDGGANVTMLDLSSGKATTRSKNVLFVLGWAAERH
jgi:Tol biopolymer transport system component